MSTLRLGALAAVVVIAFSAPSLALSPQDPCACRSGDSKLWIWISPEEIRRLPMSGPAWDARPAERRGVLNYAQQAPPTPNIANRDDNADVLVLAKALVYLRLKEDPLPLEDPEIYRGQVQDLCLAARGTENNPGGNTLALGRNLLGYVLAASMIDWDDAVAGRREADFRSWVAGVRTEPFQEGLLTRTLVTAHEHRPNNWGLMCGASRLAADLYLCDVEGECKCWNIFRRWLGDLTSPFDFHLADWGGPVPPDLSWQHDRASLVGINPRSSVRVDCLGITRSLDGVMPEEMRRAGRFKGEGADTLLHGDRDWMWPAYPASAARDYNWEAMQAVVAQAVMFARRGRDPWSLADRAIERALLWLQRELQFPVTDPQAGDEAYWLPSIANRIYDLDLPEPATTKPGRQVGFADWTTLNPAWP